jgi:hypothetical protein
MLESKRLASPSSEMAVVATGICFTANKEIVKLYDGWLGVANGLGLQKRTES